MPFEMSCPHCEGRMMVDTLGIVVECPHCGTHLAIPAEVPGVDLSLDTSVQPIEELEDTSNNDPDSKATWFAGDDSPPSISDFSGLSGISQESPGSGSNILVSEPELQTESEVPSALRVVNPDPSAVVPAIVPEVQASEPISSFPVVGSKQESPEPITKSQSEVEDPILEVPSEASAEQWGEFSEGFPLIEGTGAENVSDSALNFMAGESQPDDQPMPAIVTGEPAAEQPVLEAPQTTPLPASIEPDNQSTYDAVYSSRGGKRIPNVVFQVWLSYTLLLTGTLAMAIYYIYNLPTSKLESLPDVKPPVDKSGNMTRLLVPEKAAMPHGHTLVLNQTQRFGNIEVTPLKVTKGDLTLIGRDYVDESRRVQHEGKVLKLWLKFKNVSEDQTIAPLDNDLLFFRDRDRNDRANNFVCRESEKEKQGDLVRIYDHWFEGDYNIQDANIGTEIKPGEEVTVFIPTEPEGWSELDGLLIWRVHVRKGYSPSNYGVTTIFEVEFESDSIQAESASA